VCPVSTQAPVDWRLGECGNKFIEVYTDANIVMGAESADEQLSYSLSLSLSLSVTREVTPFYVVL
jgi:hypothetical protein